MSQTVSSTASPESAPRTSAAVNAPLTFMRPQDTKPVFHSARMTGDIPKIFFETEDRAVDIADMRESPIPCPLTGKGSN